jgi:hypothetical protein
MAFRSDSANLRTWDADSGWELHRIPTGPDIAKFQLRHPENPSINFYGEATVEYTGLQTQEGRPIVRTKYLVHYVNGPAARSDPEQRRLIEEALLAFGYIHDGPIGPVEVAYK